MTTTISKGETTVQPTLVLGYTSVRAAKNQVHEIIGRADPDVTLKAAGLRTGTLELFCTGLGLALDIEDLHAGEGVLELADTDYPNLGMSYVPVGKIELQLDDETRTRWVVRVDYQEVAS